jgi:DNA repair protein RadC
MHDLTDDEKPREKALKQGMNSLSDVELLAILLGSGIPGKSVLDLSREILKDNDNRLAYLSRKSIPELVRKYKGMGTAKATLLVAAMTFGARTQSDLQIRDPQMTTSEVVYNYMRSRLERLNNEEFWVLHLSRSNRVQSVEQISKGGLTQTSVDVKLIGKSIIDRLSAGVILCHNHPSGNLVASSADDAITRKIVEVCKLLDVNVLDHLIIGPTGYYSYRDEGKL